MEGVYVQHNYKSFVGKPSLTAKQPRRDITITSGPTLCEEDRSDTSAANAIL